MAFAAQDGFDGTLLGDREYDDRHTVFAGKRESRAIHHLQVLLNRFLMADFVVSLGLGVLFRISAVNPVDVRCLEHRLRLQFRRAQHGCGVGREERISGAGRKQNHAPLTEVLHGAFTVVSLTDRRHRQRRQRARLTSGPLDGRLKREAIHHGQPACPSYRRQAAARRARILQRRERYCRRRRQRRARHRVWLPPQGCGSQTFDGCLIYCETAGGR